MAPDAFVERLVTKKFTLNKTVFKMLAKYGALPEKELQDITLKVIRDYQDRFGNARGDGLNKTDAFDEATNEKRLLIARVQQATLHQVTNHVRETYEGEKYRWVESTAEVPDDLHRKKWGKIFTLGKGESPGERYGCQCGMDILVKGTRLDLEDINEDD